MEFKNYCVVIMGDTKDAIAEVEKVSDSKPNTLNAKGIVIATFTSFVDIKELTAWFSMNNRSFMVFELNEANSGYQIMKEEIHEGLFGFIKNSNETELGFKTIEFLKGMESNDSQIEDAIVVENKGLTLEEISKLTTDEKDEIINKIMDNGVENLSDNDKEILLLLSK